MSTSDKSTKVVVQVGPADNPYAKIIVREKRKRLRDRRKLQTYIARDLRKGVADRRQSKTQTPFQVKRKVADRRKINTYVADERRSGIADRRNRKRFLPPLWEVVVVDPK